MALEVATYISDLVPANPPGTDQVSQGDDHIRLIKQVLQTTFAGMTGAATTFFLPLTGGTLTGSVMFTGASTSIGMTKAASGGGNYITAYTGANARWQMVLGDTTAEGGSNAGSNFSLSRYTDAGGYIDAPLSINRASGSATFSQQLNISKASGTQAFVNYVATRSWLVGQQTDGSYIIYDATAPRNNLLIDIAGNWTIGGTLACPSTATFASVIDVGSNGVGYTALAPTRLSFKNPSSSQLTLFAGGSIVGTITVTPCDIRLKENIGPAKGDALKELCAIELMSFDMPDRSGADNPTTHVSMGYSAQQLREIIPEAVNPEVPTVNQPDRDYETDPWREDEMLLTVDTGPILARCVAAIKQLTARIATLEAQIGEQHA